MRVFSTRLARAVEVYDEWYDGIIYSMQKRFDRLCRKVEEFIDRAIKTALTAVYGLTEAYRKVIHA